MNLRNNYYDYKYDKINDRLQKMSENRELNYKKILSYHEYMKLNNNESPTKNIYSSLPKLKKYSKDPQLFQKRLVPQFFPHEIITDLHKKQLSLVQNVKRKIPDEIEIKNKFNTNNNIQNNKIIEKNSDFDISEISRQSTPNAPLLRKERFKKKSQSYHEIKPSKKKNESIQYITSTPENNEIYYNNLIQLQLDKIEKEKIKMRTFRNKKEEKVEKMLQNQCDILDKLLNKKEKIKKEKHQQINDSLKYKINHLESTILLKKFEDNHFNFLLNMRKEINDKLNTFEMQIPNGNFPRSLLFNSMVTPFMDPMNPGFTGHPAFSKLPFEEREEINNKVALKSLDFFN